MSKDKIFIINSQGEKEFFSWKKVYRSAKRAGASSKIAKEIANEIEKKVYPGMTTREIFNEVRRLLKKASLSSSIRFSLKEGIRKLGPTGFPFEKYIGGVLLANGYSNVKNNLYLKGNCASYEIDFIATKDNTLFIGECKYHHLPGERVDLQVALYNFARYLDLKDAISIQKYLSYGMKVKAMLVTNTKFTSQARNYSKCVGVELLGWNWPPQRGLEYLITKEGLYPITVLPSLTRGLRDIFLSHKITLAKDLLNFTPKELSKTLNIPQKKADSLWREANYLFKRSLT